jgi:hypothetical protein
MTSTGVQHRKLLMQQLASSVLLEQAVLHISSGS